MEIIQIRKIKALAYWFYIKGFLVIVGSGGAVAASLSGEISEKIYSQSAAIHPLIELHSRWAKGSTVLFALLAIFYIFIWVSRLEIITKVESILGLQNFQLLQLFKRLIYWTAMSPLMILPALIGLLAITITGGLGAALTHGSDSDIFVSFIYYLFFKN